MNAREWVQNGTTSHGAGWWKSLAGAGSYGWRSLDTPSPAFAAPGTRENGVVEFKEYRDGGERMGAERTDIARSRMVEVAGRSRVLRMEVPRYTFRSFRCSRHSGKRGGGI